MTEAQLLMKIHEDLEFLKKEVSEIHHVIKNSPEIREEIIAQAEEASRRIASGRFVKNEDLRKKFG